MKAQRHALFNGLGHVDGVTATTVMKPHTKGNAPIPTDPQAQDHRFEITATVFTIAIGRAGPLVVHLTILVSTVEGNRGGILMPPGGVHLVDVECPQGNGTKDGRESGVIQGIERLSQTAVMQGRRRQARWQQG